MPCKKLRTSMSCQRHHNCWNGFMMRVNVKFCDGFRALINKEQQNPVSKMWPYLRHNSSWTNLAMGTFQLALPSRLKTAYQREAEKIMPRTVVSLPNLRWEQNITLTQVFECTYQVSLHFQILLLTALAWNIQHRPTRGPSAATTSPSTHRSHESR